MKLKGGRYMWIIAVKVLLQIAITCMTLIIYGGATYGIWIE